MAHTNELPLDCTYIDEWFIRAAFNHPEHDIEEAVNMTRIDANTCGEDPRFIIMHDKGTGILQLLTMGSVIGTQFEALSRTSFRYPLILGHTAASNLITVNMNVESVVSGHPLPYLDEAYEALEKPEFTQIEIDMLTGSHAPGGLLVTSHARNFLLASEA